MIDHGGEHALEPEEEAELHSDQDDREHDSNDSGDESNPVVKQIAGREREDQCHGRIAKSIRRYAAARRIIAGRGIGRKPDRSSAADRLPESAGRRTGWGGGDWNSRRGESKLPYAVGFIKAFFPTT